MVVTRPWRLPRSTEVREVRRGRYGRTVLARLDGEAGEVGDLVAVRYIPAGLLIHRPRAEAFWADVARLTGLEAPEAVPFRQYVHAPGFMAAYARSAGAVGAVGGALVSDAVEGVTLSRVLDRYGALPPPAALLVHQRALRALAAAHGREVVHGDLRPAKVLIDADGVPAVTGLGLAALTTGAAGLRAPELWRGDGAATPGGDVYGAACVLHLCLTGELPFPVRQLFSLMARHTTAPVPMEAVPGPLRAPLAAGLTKDPALRPGAEALLTHLERTARTALGRDWEERGRSALRTLAAPLAEALPLASPNAGDRPLRETVPSPTHHTKVC
ncbi:protein kinase domain-containing protein [Streptomyces avermitilis]|uniref:protein kinase domain-containing protein n=1 Tax=Streptomyces avermitilis TaxID=33903 RepID=UPI0033E74C7F